MLRNTVLAVCMISAGASLLGGIVSGTRLGRHVTFTVDLILLAALLSPFVSILRPGYVSSVFSDITFDEESAGKKYRKMLCAETAGRIKEMINEQMNARGIYCAGIEPVLNISDKGCIIIECVRIETSSPDAAAEVIRYCLGAETEVIDEADRTSP